MALLLWQTLVLNPVHALAHLPSAASVLVGGRRGRSSCPEKVELVKVEIEAESPETELLGARRLEEAVHRVQPAFRSDAGGGLGGNGSGGLGGDGSGGLGGDGSDGGGLGGNGSGGLGGDGSGGGGLDDGDGGGLGDDDGGGAATATATTAAVAA
ncbi:glycine-rich RNA-binding protein 3, mitochondrial-like [Ananas comosus]|uniref:Glycine-rich RNA-binding protein 3, mitochondrial-like n=1 Tax=Ananas comosus TaxID=4615 RepID=A0A6P5F5F5_ANACO|nr:glycine-rich RNA-binding protein 3, mitochondrial-like [Ananas comosus]